MIDPVKLLAWLDALAADAKARDTTTGFVKYAIYQGLRERVARGQFDEDPR